jgi:excisionase family DNA binding protein
LFRVPLSTLRDWAAAGKINARCTLGGHRRYPESEVRALLNELAGVA